MAINMATVKRTIDKLWRTAVAKNRVLWLQQRYKLTVIISLAALVIVFFVNYQANLYASEAVSNYVNDILLDNLPVVNVDFFFFEGMAMFWVFVAILLLFMPEKAPFAIECVVLFILIRAGFITLTHLGLPPQHSYIEPNDFLRYITLGNDMFFSSHAGSPYLLALVFWDQKIIRWIFIAFSVFFAAVVLLGHLHYSIDVFGAFFITYSIFAIARYLFPFEHKLYVDYHP
jgi:hypothetical protein